MSFIGLINKKLENLAIEAIKGSAQLRVATANHNNEKSLFGSGVLLNIGKNEVTSADPLERSVISSTPVASVIIKKKFFAGFAHNNDLQWLDTTERFLLRATKALFLYKVTQIRAYESLTKLEDFYRDYNQVNLDLFVEAYNNAQLLSIPNENVDSGLLSIIGNAISNSLENLAYDEYKEDVLKILQRNAFSTDIRLSTWIIDPTSTENYGTGPGTGVIELTNVSSFSTNTSIESNPSSATFSMVDPYRLLNIYEDDIEVAINEALLGNIGLFESIVNGELGIENVDAKSMVASVFEYIGLGQIDNTIDMDYVRDRLRTFYLGKTIVNAGDSVHFFIRSNKVIHNMDEFVDESFYEIDETILEAERNLFTNKSIDLDTYKKLRSLSDNSFGMRHVYAGLAIEPSHSYSSGGWQISVTVLDNMKWLQWSRFMFEPALSDPQGILEDPLTPYKLEVDASGRVLTSGGAILLDENKQLINSGLLMYDSGILNGQFATENNLLQGQYNFAGSLKNNKILQHPHGLVYRWKNGIIATTAAINSVDPRNEDQISQKIHAEYYGLTVAQDVLTNLDVANILSILIVGQPYNVDSFIRQAYEAQNYNKSSSSNSLNALNQLSSVLDVVKKQNRYFGNFRPYRMITMSNQSVNESFNSNLMRKDINDNLIKLRSRKIELNRRIRDLSKVTNSTLQNPNLLVRALMDEVSDIDKTINEQIKNAQNSITSVGDALTENFNLFGTNRVLPLTGNFTADQNVTRAMMLVGAQRRIEDVRLNRDQNLLVISDQYDEGTDIRPFLLALRDSNFKVFQGTYVSVYEKCVGAAKIPNFEFFCNSQGHLEFRPPQWNKTPLTVLQELINLKKEKGINVIPDFLEDLFNTKISSSKLTIHQLNIKIVILALLLGKFPDRTIIPGISRTGENSLRFFGVKPSDDGPALNNSIQSSFNKLSSDLNRLFSNQLSLDISLSEEGDVLNADTSTILGQFDQIFQEQNNVFQNVYNVASKTDSSSAMSEKYANPDAVNSIRDSFRTSYGLDPASGIIDDKRPFSEKDFIYYNSSIPNNETDVVSKIEKYLSKLQETISDRDQLVSSLLRIEEKRDELNEIDSIFSSSAVDDEDSVSGPLDGAIELVDKLYNTTKAINDIFTGDATKGSVFDHLIEDNTRNLLGPGSGRRFIINDIDIISAEFSENIPQLTRVNVVGTDAFIGSRLDNSFDGVYYWAGATDFDMWRQYGYIEGPESKLPYANNAETQCKPFAYFELQLQRAKINTGNLTVVGNEYYEPGDNIYIPTKGLMYYVSSVSHSFEYNGSFVTRLTLTNGHAPGIYLPSPLDIIGQQYIKDDPTATIPSYRNIQGDDSYRALQPDSSIVFPPGALVTQSSITSLLDYKDNMVRYTNMMIDLSSIINNSRVVLIRGFIRNEEDRSRVENNISIIKSLLTNPIMLSQGQSSTAIGDDLFDFGSSALRGFGSQTSSTKNSISMQLPNGLPVAQIEPAKIVEQIVTLNNQIVSTGVSEITCVNSITAEYLNSGDSALLPKGGPKQKTWLDIRDDLTQVSNIIEVGILDIYRDLK